MRLRFVHAADLHLDSPFTGLKSAAPDNVARLLYEATFDAYTNIIDLCISERVDALLVAGDIYDSADRSFRAQHRFIAGLQQLDNAGIRSFVCHGNHDPLDGWEARLDYPPSCHRFGSEFEAVPVFADEPDRAVVHGISYPTRDVYDNLALRLGWVDDGPFSIGLMHANVDNNPGHDLYAPCSLDDLVRSGIDYWALGHVHTRQVLSERSPTVVYPGNSQGRHPNETGARGAYLVEVDDDRSVQMEFRAMDTVRWERTRIDIGAIETEQELLDALDERMLLLLDTADGRPVIARVTLSGRGELHRFLRRAYSAAAMTENLNENWVSRTPFLWCERIDVETASPFDRSARLAGSDFLAEALRAVDQAKDDPELLSRLSDGIPDLFEHRRFRAHLPGSAPADEEVAVLIDEAEAIIVDLLAEDD